MIHTTAAAPKTNRDGWGIGISAITIQADQRLWRGTKAWHRLLLGHQLKIAQGHTPSLTSISCTDLLQIDESLLAQAAVIALGPKLQQLMQRIRAVANLQSGHPSLGATDPTLEALHPARSSQRVAAAK